MRLLLLIVYDGLLLNNNKTRTALKLLYNSRQLRAIAFIKSDEILNCVKAGETNYIKYINNLKETKHLSILNKNIFKKL